MAWVIVLLLIIAVLACIIWKTKVIQILGGNADNCYSKSRLDDLTKYLKTLQTSALIISHNNETIYEYGDITKSTIIASCRKSMLSILYGIYNIDINLTLKELNIDDIGGLSDIEKSATIRDLLLAQSGINHPASNGGDDLEFAPPRGTLKPGERHIYSNWDFNALGTIFEQITKTDIYDAFEQKLAIPLEMQDFDRSLQVKGGNLTKSIHPSYHFLLSARDMCKIGNLMLNNGVYKGVQIVPAAWVKESTTLVHKVSDMIEKRQHILYGYGYLWWPIDSDNKNDSVWGSFRANGMNHQYIVVLPKLNTVIVHKRFPERDAEGKEIKHNIPFDTILRKIINSYGC